VIFPIHYIHPEDGNCYVCSIVGRILTNDMAGTQTPKLEIK
jgi:hypothetical protein